MYQSKNEKKEEKEKEKEQEGRDKGTGGASASWVDSESLPKLLSAISGVIADPLSTSIHKLHLYINQQPEELKSYITKFIGDFLWFTILPIQLIDKDMFDPKIEKLSEEHPVLWKLQQIINLASNFITSDDLEDESLKTILKEIKIFAEERIKFLVAAAPETLTTLLTAIQIIDEYGNYYFIPQSTGLQLANIDEFNHKYEKPFEGAHIVVRMGNLHFKSAGEGESLRLQPICGYAASSLLNLLADKKKIIAAPTMLIKVCGVEVKPDSDKEVKTLSWPIQVSHTIEGILLLDLITLVELVILLQKTHGDKLVDHWSEIINGNNPIAFFEREDLRKFFDIKEDQLNSYLKKIFSYMSQLFSDQTPENQINSLLTILEKFDAESFSALSMANLLVKPTDGKFDNFMVAIDYDEKNHICALRIVGIDNDHAFGASYLATNNNKHFVDFKCGIFLLPQMLEPIHQNVRERLLESPAVLLLTWLAQIYQQQLRYEQMYENGVLTKEDLEKLDYPFKIRPGMLAEMYNKLKTINNLVRLDPHMSLARLAEAVEPIVLGCHKKIKTKYSSLLTTMQMLIRGDTLEKLYKGQLDQVIGGAPIDGETTLGGILRNCKITIEQYQAERTQALFETVKELLLVLDREELMDFNVLRVIAEITKTLPFIELPLSKVDRKALLRIAVSEGNQLVINLLKYEKRQTQAIMEDFSLLGPEDNAPMEIITNTEQLKKLAAIAGLGTFTALSFEGYPGFPKEIKRLEISLLFPHLTYLDLKGDHITDTVIETFILNCPKLQIISLTNVSGIKAIKNKSWFESKLSCPGLKIVTINNCENLGEINLLAQRLNSVLIRDCIKLVKLEIETAQECHADLSQCPELKSQDEIKFLLVHHLPVDKKNIALLENNRFYNVLKTLCEGGVERLDLTNCKLDKHHIKLLANALENNTSLKELILDNNKIDDKGALFLAKALRRNHSLTVLSLENNKIGDLGIHAFAEMLSVNKRLTKLSLRNNKSFPSSCTASIEQIVAGLERNNKLAIIAGREQVSRKVLITYSVFAFPSQSEFVATSGLNDTDHEEKEHDGEKKRNKGKEKTDYKKSSDDREKEREHDDEKDNDNNDSGYDSSFSLN